MKDKTADVCVTVPGALADQARALAGDPDLSAYVIRALTEQMRRDQSTKPSELAAAVNKIRAELRQAERYRLRELADSSEEANGPVSQERADELREEWRQASLEQGINPLGSTGILRQSQPNQDSASLEQKVQRPPE